MPRLSSWFVHASLIYLALGFTLGALMLANKGLEFYALIWRLQPIHIEMLMMGWFVQLAAGMTFWILPRLSGSSPRGNEWLVWLAFWLINFGIGMVILEVITSLTALLLLGRLAEFGGVLAFVVGSWKRVKSFGR
jgi:hypothetical protein